MQTELDTIEIEIDRAKEAIALRDKLNRLEATPEFKEIILDDYLSKEPARLAKLKVDPSMQTEINQNMIMDALAGVGSLNMYLMKIRQVAQVMESSMEDLELTRAEMLQEE